MFRFHQLEGPKMVGEPGDPVKTQLKAKTQWRICEKLLLESSAICNVKAKHLAYGNAGLYWLSKFREKEPRSWYNFHWPHTETDSAAYLWSLLSTSVWSPIQKKFPLYAWVSAKTLNFENTYPQHFEWNSLSKRLREAFWNLKQILFQFDLMDVSV